MKEINIKDPCKSEIIQFFSSFEGKLVNFLTTYEHIWLKN